jgi:AcrR family transcriptional regulator
MEGGEFPLHPYFLSSTPESYKRIRGHSCFIVFRVAMTKRDAICDTALELFAEKGIEATTTREIAEQAGAAEGTLYRHFDGKADLAQSLYRRCTLELQEMLVDADENATAPPERLDALVRSIFDFYATKPASCTYLLSARESGVAAKNDDETLLSPIHMIAEVLDAGMQEGDFPEASATLVAGWILAMIQRTVLFLKDDALPLDEQDTIDRTVEAIRCLAETTGR